MSTLETAAWLHAHGVGIDAGSLDEALRAAIAADGPPAMYGISGQEGLTAAEIAVLHEGGAVTDAPAQGASDPQVDAIVVHARLLATGFTTQAAAKHLGVSDARVRQRIDEGSLLALRQGRSWRLPAFQFTDDGEVPGWAAVCKALPRDGSPVALWRWFSLPQDDLVVGDDETPTSPQVWLLSGHPVDLVVELAAGLR